MVSETVCLVAYPPENATFTAPGLPTPDPLPRVPIAFILYPSNFILSPCAPTTATKFAPPTSAKP